MIQNDIHREHLLRSIKPFTMVDTERLHALYDFAERINNEQIAGDIVHCGVCNGGSAAIAAHTIDEESQRTVWLFDSFQGLPQSQPIDGPDGPSFEGKCKGTIASTKLAFAICSVPPQKMRIVPGWFADTLSKAPIHTIAMLNIDADFYDSVYLVLETFYDRVVPGGIIYIDDYGYWPGCKVAVDEFFEKHGITTPFIMIDDIGGYFCKDLA